MQKCLNQNAVTPPHYSCYGQIHLRSERSYSGGIQALIRPVLSLSIVLLLSIDGDQDFALDTRRAAVHKMTRPSMSFSTFNSILISALDGYRKQTGKDLASDPLHAVLQHCSSPGAMLTVLQDQMPDFYRSDAENHGLTNMLVPMVNVLYVFSVTLGEGVGLIFSPAKLIFAGVGVLLMVANDVSAGRNTLIHIFGRIEFFMKRLESYTEVPPTAGMRDVIVRIMTEILSILALATKEMERGRMKKYFKKLMGRTGVEDALQRLDVLTQEEVRMAGAELLRITRSIEDKADQAKRNHLHDSHIKWLSPPDPSTNHNVAYQAHHRGTAQWFLRRNIYKRWKSTGSFLWIDGKPGSGKTILCSAIVQDITSLRDVGGASVAYFYFDFRDIQKQNRRDLLYSLLIQLSAQFDPFCDVLSRLFDSHDHGTRKPSDLEMIECLKEMLFLPSRGPIYIIMDAIDECSSSCGIPSSREQVLELVSELVGLRLPNLHICVSGRPEFDIRAVFHSLEPHTVSLHDEHGQKQDIASYISSIVHSDPRMRRWRDEDKKLVIETLTEKAGGMFRWVFCQLEALRHCFPPSVQTILQELPEGLDETYERILKEMKKANQPHAHRLLQCLAVAVRPLCVDELAEVLAVDLDAGSVPRFNPEWRWADREEAVLTACSSLVTIDRHSRVVQFSHCSVKDFLTSGRLAQSSEDVSRYHILPEPAHTILAQACLGVLLRLDGSIHKHSVKDFPLARYAAEHWVNHAQFGKVSSCIKDGMLCLFDADRLHFRTWIWLHNEDRRWNSTSGMHPTLPEAVPLYYAARFGFRDLVEHFLTIHPAHVNAKGGYYGTPLFAALSEGHVEVSSLLHSRGAAVDIPGKWDQTPLHKASAEGRLENGKWLLARGANANARDNDGWTPLYLAALHGHLEFARVLLAHDAHVDVQDDRGRTPLSRASENGRREVVWLLLEHGANAGTRDICGRNASQVAAEKKHRAIVQLLSDYKPKPKSTCARPQPPPAGSPRTEKATSAPAPPIPPRHDAIPQPESFLHHLIFAFG